MHHFSDGYPRLINIICDHALLTGYAAGQKIIDVDTIKVCEHELRRPIKREKAGRQAGSAPLPSKGGPAGAEPGPQQPKGFKLGLAVVFMLLLLFTGYLVYESQNSGEPRWKMEEIAPQTYEGLTGRDAVTPAVPPAAEADSAAVQPPPKPEPPKKAVAEVEGGSGAQASTARDKPRVENPFGEESPLIVYFQHNSNEVNDEGFELLNTVAGYLSQHPQQRISIKGYTDSTGARSYNLSVSEFRANAIKSFLVGKGVDAANITAVGKGPDNPIASNDTLEGREKNRRVEIELLDEG